MPSSSFDSLGARWRAAGAAVLAVGLAAAGLVYVLTPPPTTDVGAPGYIPPEATKEYAFQMERLGGKMNEFAYDLTSWFVGLWHGRTLAFTLAILAAAGALACFTLAHLIDNYTPEEPADGRN